MSLTRNNPIVFMIMLTRSLERIFNQMRCTGKYILVGRDIYINGSPFGIKRRSEFVDQDKQQTELIGIFGFYSKYYIFMHCINIIEKLFAMMLLFKNLKNII